MKYDIMFIGPCTMDCNIDFDGTESRVIGGAVTFCAPAAAAAGANVFASVKANPADTDILDTFPMPKDHTAILPSPVTTLMRNEYFTPDRERRRATCQAQSDPITPDQIPDVDCGLYHLAGLLYGDFPNELIIELSKRGKVAADIQGFLRHNENGVMKVGKIIKSDESRKYVVPSAPGKRSSKDTKVTDMLYACYDLAEKDEDFRVLLMKIKDRYDSIINGLHLKLALDSEFTTIAENFKAKAGVDYAASRGEYLNGIIMAHYLGYEFIDSATVIFFDKDGNFDAEKTDKVLSKKLEKTPKAVIPGFYGSNPDGSVKTFSRGGSDVTGSIVAKACRASMYENWTDVSGCLVADPRIIDDPEPIKVVTYRELRELSYMGASVLHEDAVFPVRKAGIPINIKNTNDPDADGTLIVESTCQKPEYTITGIAGKKGFVAVNIDKDKMNSEVGFCRKALQAFEENGISIEHMPSGIDTMTVFVHQAEFEGKEQQVISSIRRLAHPDIIDLEADLALIAVVGRGMKSNRGTAGRIFSALAHANINVRMIDQGSSELNIIIGVSNSDFDNAIKAIYDIFVETRL